jgi:hypothetical protein
MTIRRPRIAPGARQLGAKARRAEWPRRPLTVAESVVQSPRKLQVVAVRSNLASSRLGARPLVPLLLH